MHINGNTILEIKHLTNRRAKFELDVNMAISKFAYDVETRLGNLALNIELNEFEAINISDPQGIIYDLTHQYLINPNIPGVDIEEMSPKNIKTQSYYAIQ